MLVIAGRQHYLARTQHLSPWEGGGFGMFSGADQPVSRFVRVSLTGADGPAGTGLIPADAATDRSWRKILAMPSPGRVQAFADTLATQTWVPDGYDPFGTGVAGRQGFYRRLGEGEPAPHPGAFPEPRTVRVEVLRRVFDAATATVTTESLATAEAAVRAR